MRNSLVILIALLIAAAIPALSQGNSGNDAKKDEPAQKTAEQVFKNIQSLKGVPADQVIPAMQYFSASLGVQCNFCHVDAPAWAPEKDDKKEKLTARNMIAMTQEIDKANFKGRTEVGCATCHGGRSSPVSVPPLGEDRPKTARQEEGKSQPARPTADQIFQNYFTALGGKAALEKLTTKVTKGSVSTPFGKLPFEVDQKAPGMFLVSVTLPNGAPYAEGVNSASAWRLEGRGATDMGATDQALAHAGARFFDPELNPPANSISPRVGVAIVDGHPCYVVGERGGEGVFVRLDFDQQSGLLLRRTVLARTLFGALPSQWDYSDYRDVNGVKVAFTITRGRWDGTFVFTADSIEFNAPLEDSKFQKPAAAPTRPPTPTGAAR